MAGVFIYSTRLLIFIQYLSNGQIFHCFQLTRMANEKCPLLSQVGCFFPYFSYCHDDDDDDDDDDYYYYQGCRQQQEGRENTQLSA